LSETGKSPGVGGFQSVAIDCISSAVGNQIDLLKIPQVIFIDRNLFATGRKQIQGKEKKEVLRQEL
jgi:hypothetical protein